MTTRKERAAPRRFVLLPTRGFRSAELGDLRAPEVTALAAERTVPATQKRKAVAPVMKIVHSTGDDGPKLAELSPDALVALRALTPGVKAVPVVYYEPARLWPLQPSAPVAAARKPGVKPLQLHIVDASTNAPVRGAMVIAFTDFSARVGDGGTSNAKGIVSLHLGAASKALELLLVYSPAGYWGLLKRNLKIKNGDKFSLHRIDLSVPDFVTALYGAKPPTAGTGVKVGVIDTGVDSAHSDLVVAGGAVLVADEKDSGTPGPAKRDGEHGTHVAGIVASRGAAPAGKRGIAPSADLYSYRVFPNGGGGATNYDILRAIDRGVSDGCDLLNLSLGGSEPDEAVREAIKAAFDAGTLCIVAAGNGGHAQVSYPAAWPEAIAVTAIGKKGTYPKDSTEVLDEMAPFSRVDKSVYLAGYSNVGPEVDFTGPGTGIVSTLPGGAYGVMSGTSMACPAVTGVAAALLSSHGKVLKMPRDRKRSLAIMKLIATASTSLGLGTECEGLGLPTKW